MSRLLFWLRTEDKSLLRSRHLRHFLSRVFQSTLGRNVLSLYMLQFANYILPLITVPYLVRVLGPEKFGLIAFGQSLIAYFVLLVNYGFDWSATRAIAAQRGNLQEVGRIASAVWVAKLLLCILSFAILTGVIGLIPRFREMSALLCILFGIVVGNVLFPQWLFQGLERMVTVSMINLGVKVLVTAGIFVFICRPEDFLKYAGLLAGQWLCAGMMGLFWSIWQLRIPIRIPLWENVVRVFRDGWAVFLSTAAISLYTTSNAFILGLLTNNTIVGYYAAAERIVKALHSLVSPLSQGFYPRVSSQASLGREEGLRWAQRALISIGGMGTLISAGLFMGTPLIVRLLLGSQYESSIPVMRLLSFLPFLIAFSNVFGVQVMLPFRLDKPFLVILTSAGFVNVLLALFFVPLLQATGMAVAVTLTEFYVTASMFWYLRAKGLLPVRLGTSSREGIP